jgi:demethylmenaquinone methyltransferase/2-methoxy-6-polyprenyl-1,4-benzoquinol methylase
MKKDNKDQYSGKRAAIGEMFDSIAWRYDFLNHFLSFGLDRFWRRKAISSISGRYKKPHIIDIATGTGDLALAALKLDPAKITGIDISEGMLKLGEQKLSKSGLTGKIQLMQGESENISFPDETFDIAMSGFGVRNFADPEKGLKEMNRVLKPGGTIMILEFSRPTLFPFKQLYYFYFLHILPFFGRLFSKNKTAYRYLPDTVMKFPDNHDFLRMIQRAGFIIAWQEKLTFGIASIYTGVKPIIQ